MIYNQSKNQKLKIENTIGGVKVTASKRKPLIVEYFLMLLMIAFLIVIIFTFIQQQQASDSILVISIMSVLVIYIGLYLMLSLTEIQELEIGANKLLIKKVRPIFSKTYQIDLKKNDRFKLKAPWQGTQGSTFLRFKKMFSPAVYPVPHINQVLFFEHYDLACRKWIVQYLNEIRLSPIKTNDNLEF